MKRMLSILLAVACTLTMGTVAFAADSDFDGAIFIVDYDTDLSLGETYTFDIENVRENGRSYDVDTDFMKDYRVKVNVDDGEKYASASLVKKSGEYKLQIKVKSSSRGADEDVVINFEVEEKKGNKEEWTSEDYTFTLLSDEDNVDTYIDDNNEEWDIPTDERHVIEVEDDIKKATLNFDDYVFVELDRPTKDIYAFHMETDYEDEDAWDDAPSNADLEFVNFKSATSFGKSTTVRIVPLDDSMKYLYEITSSGTYVLLDDSLNRDDEFEFTTTQLGSYVMSTKAISGASTSSGTGSPVVNSAGEKVIVDVGTTTITYTELENAFKKVNTGGTAVLAITDTDVVSNADIKSVIAKYPNRNLTVVKQDNGKTIYQYKLTATQLANLQGSNIALGVEMGAEDTTTLFQKFYSQKMYVLGHHNVVSVGANGSYAVDFSKINLTRTNLKLYWYDATRNYFDPINGAVTFDKNNYGYFTAPVGYDIIISEGPMVHK